MLDLFDKYEFDASNRFNRKSWIKQVGGLKALALAQLFGRIAKDDYLPMASRSQKEIAEEMGLSVRCLQNFLKKLISLGYLIQINSHKGCRQKIYVATFPEYSELETLQICYSALTRFKIKYTPIISLFEKKLCVMNTHNVRNEHAKCAERAGSPYINPVLTLDLRCEAPKKAAPETPNLEPENFGEIIQLDLGEIALSEDEEEAFKTWKNERSISRQDKKAAHRVSAPKKCKIGKLLLRLNTKLEQKQIDELVRIWSVYKPELALPHLERKLSRFNSGTWNSYATFSLWRKDGLVWHDADRGRYKDELIFGYGQGPLDEESHDLVLKDREKLKAYESKKRDGINRTPARTELVDLQKYIVISVYKTGAEECTVSADSKAAAIEKAGTYDRSRDPIFSSATLYDTWLKTSGATLNTIVTEVTI